MPQVPELRRHDLLVAHILSHQPDGTGEAVQAGDGLGRNRGIVVGQIALASGSLIVEMMPTPQRYMMPLRLHSPSLTAYTTTRWHQ
jgi:hypothetical protein